MGENALGGQKVRSVFREGSSGSQLSSTSFKAIVFHCAVTAAISACIFKKHIKIGEFLCSHFNIEDGRKSATVLAYCAFLSQER